MTVRFAKNGKHDAPSPASSTSTGIQDGKPAVENQLRILFPGSAWELKDRRLCLREAAQTRLSCRLWRIWIGGNATRQSLGTARAQAEPGHDANSFNGKPKATA